MTIVDLVFSQRVFKQIGDHIAAFPGTSVFGGLVGHLFEDPTCERRWALVERGVRSPSTIPETADAGRLGQTLRATEMEWTPRPGEVLLGWYRIHVDTGLYLSPDEARFHEGAFPDAWGLAVVIAGAGGRAAGGVFQRTDPEGLSRSVYTPFYELVDPSSEFNGTTRRTFVGWANYQTEVRVIRAGHGSVSDEIPEARTRSKKADGAAAGPAAAAEAKPEGPGSKAAAEAKPEGPGPKAAAAEAKPEGPGPKAAPPARPAAPTPAPESKTAGPPGTSARPAATSAPDEPPPAVGPFADRVASPPRHARKPGRPRSTPPRDDGPVDSEAEWEKRQIQRSLMAVGRSLGPAELGPPATGGDELSPPHRPAAGSGRPPEPDEAPKPERAPPPATPAPGPSLPARAAPSGRAPAETRTVIPLHEHPDAGSGMVGRSRRRRRLPGGRVLAAVAGLILVATAGVVGTRTMRHGGPTRGAGDSAATEELASSPATITLSPGELLRRERARPGDTDGTGDSNSAAPQTDPAGGDASADADAGSTVPDPADGDAGGADAVEGTGAEGAGATGGTPRTSSGSTDAGISAAPSLEGLSVDDPAVGAYGNSLAIFRQEAGRYEQMRQRFDEGAETCNPLNLSYRGVRDAFDRLERRRDEAGERLSSSELRTFDGVQREFAMIRTHYTLTDCPMPVGG